MAMPRKFFGLLEDCLDAWKNSGQKYYLDYSMSLMSNYHDDAKVIKLRRKYNIQEDINNGVIR